MQKQLFKSLLVVPFALWGLVSVSACSGLSEKKPLLTSSPHLKKIVIVHTNDIHGRAWPFLREDGKWMGGYAAQANIVYQLKQEAEKENAAFLLLSAGDVNTGVPESDFTEGKPDFEAMNLMGYDAMTVGNHDLDRGLSLLEKQKTWAKFPFLTANIKSKTSVKEPWEASVLIEKNGIRIGIIGVTTDQLLNLILTEHAQKLSVHNPKTSTRKEIQKLKQQGVDLILVLSHLGVAESGLGLHQYVTNDDRKLARSLPEIDLIVGGHSHTFLDSGILEGDALIVQAGYRGDFLGKAEIFWNPKEKKVVSKKASLIEVDPEKGVDKEVKETVNSYKKLYEKELSEPVFESKEIIIGQRNRIKTLELPLGSLVCDALRAEMKTDLAFFNSGGIRSNLPKGTVRRRDILEAFPFRNTVATGTLKGREVAELLNDGVNRGRFGGGVLQVSGLRYEIKDGKVSGVWIEEKPIQLDKTYSFATNSYVISAGDKLKTMKQAKRISIHSKKTDEALIAYLKKSVIPSQEELPRIKNQEE